ncbi:uncharacterized protein LOC115623168 [Scaptodrosophila lebanonensis]|uniref:Uncharacterized protein LOC115623168 n=1 Tax=Drosophila lebanonensis TaxID=7225 RepID=A0A6J2TB33_DROLE|nr:uncharacterized protein LOC115623168 [Scaptodrosophila lebanonensis]
MSADEEETYTAAAAGNPGAVQRSPLEPLASMANTPLLNHRRDPPAKQPLQLGNLQFIPKQGCPKTAFIENWLDTQQNKGPPKLGETKAYSSSIGDVSTAKDETFATTNSQKDLTNEQGAVGEKQNISANK